MELGEIIYKIVIPIIVGLAGIIKFLSKRVIKSFDEKIESIKEENDLTLKEVLLNKCDIIAIDDALDNLQGSEYTKKKRSKKTEIIQQYRALGKID